MEVRKLNHVLQLVRDILENEKMTAEIQLQLYKICELEDKFTKDFSKEERKLYLDLHLEKGQLHNLEIDHVIEITYKICKELLK